MRVTLNITVLGLLLAIVSLPGYAADLDEDGTVPTAAIAVKTTAPTAKVPAAAKPASKPANEGRNGAKEVEEAERRAAEDAERVKAETKKWSQQDDEAADRKNFEISVAGGAGHRKPSEEVRLQGGDVAEATAGKLGVTQDEKSLLERVDNIIARINDPATPQEIKRELVGLLQTIDTGSEADSGASASGAKASGATSPVSDLIDSRSQVISALNAPGDAIDGRMVVTGSELSGRSGSDLPFGLKSASKKEDESSRSAKVKGVIGKDGSKISLQNAGKATSGGGAYGWSSTEQLALAKKSDALMGLLRDRLKGIANLKDIGSEENTGDEAGVPRAWQPAGRGIASVQQASVAPAETEISKRSIILTLMGIFSTAALYQWWAGRRQEGLSLVTLLGFAPRKRNRRP